MPKKLSQLTDLEPDARNANLGTERGHGLLEESLFRYGAGRSILVDKNGNVVAGNKVLECAAAIDLGAKFIHTTGQELVVVVRDDLDLYEDKAARSLAYSDNRVADLDLEWNVPIVLEDMKELNLDQFFTSLELEHMAEVEPQAEEQVKSYTVVVECEDVEQQTDLLRRFQDEGLKVHAR
jgi:hypothetical protein